MPKTHGEGAGAFGAPAGLPGFSSLYEVFLTVADEGSFTAAARRLGYTQSAVSRQVQALEDHVRSVLFDRMPRGVRLTEAGRVLRPHAEAVLDRIALARSELEALRTVDGGRLRVGAFATADAALMPRALAAFRERHPRVLVTRTEGLSSMLLARLEAGDLDLAVISTTGGPRLDGCVLHHLLDEPMNVLLPAGHPLAEQRSVRLAELADEEWITGGERSADTLLHPALTADFQPRRGYAVREWIAKQGFVAAGLGVTLLPALARDSVRAGVVAVPLHPDDLPPRKVYAATPHGLAPPPAVEAFLTTLREAVPEPDRATRPCR
ncbi:LysR family transcriptional regulator [Streptomyces sp. NPDC002004]